MLHMGMIMAKNNFREQDEEVISRKRSCSIVVRMVKDVKCLQKQLKLVSNDYQLHVVTNALVAFWRISNSALSSLIDE